MKKNLRYFLFASLLMIAFSSCRKYVVEPDMPGLSGHWYLQHAARFDGYKWQTIETGYENGSFVFSADGYLSYKDVLGSLKGNWTMRPVTSGYYDDNGRYTEGYHVVFSMQLYEPGNGNPAADWIFDDNDFNGGNVFKAVYTSGNKTYEYTFARE